MAAVPTEQTAHTPGPWSVCFDHPDDKCRDSIAYIRKAGAERHFGEIATVFGCDRHPEQGGNAQLISAAPDLLDALYAALPFVEDMEHDDGYKPGYVSATLATIRAAIAKAEGAQS